MIKIYCIAFIFCLFIQKIFAQSDMLYIQGVNFNSASTETPGMSFVKGGGYLKMPFFIDEPTKYTFLIEAKTNKQGVESIVKDSIDFTNPNTVRIYVKPTKFKIFAGKEYSVNTSFYDPWIQKADKDGELIVELDEPSNCTVVIEDAQGGNKLENGSFEISDEKNKLSGWNIFPSRSGTVSLTKSIKRTGENSLCLSKNENEGNISFAISKPINVEAGKSYLAAGYYHLEDAKYGSVFDFQVTISAPGKKDVVVEPLYTSQRVVYPLPIGNSKSGWDRTFMNVNIPSDYKDATVAMQIKVTGVPYKVYFDDMEFRVNPTRAAQYSNYIDNALLKPFYSKEEVFSIWEKREPVKVEQPEIGKKAIMVNGKPIPSYAFASKFSDNWPNESAHKEILKHGIKIHFIPVRSWTEDSKTRTWNGKGKYDFSLVEDNIATLLGYDPNIYVMLDISLDDYPEFCDEHPEARWVNAFGETTVNEKEYWKPATERKPNEKWNVSLTAEATQAEYSAYLKALGEFLKNSVVGKSVVGINIAGGADGQWFRKGWLYNFGTFDRSPGAEAKFREWLTAKYNNNNSALQQAWHDKTITFENVKFCSEEELNVPKFYFQSKVPGDQRFIDNLLFGEEAGIGITDAINRYCRAFKDGLGRNAIALTYYPRRHDALRNLLDKPDLDGVIAVMEYGNTRNLGQCGGIQSTPGSLKLHNKIVLSEMDYRTEFATSWGEDGNHHRRNVVVMRSPKELANEMRRDLGNNLCQGQGGWFYGLCGHVWGNEEYYLVMEEGARAAELGSTEPMYEDHGQIALFHDETVRSYMSLWDAGEYNKSQSANMYEIGAAYKSHLIVADYIRIPFSRSGLTFEDLLLTDLQHPNLAKFKVYVFANCATITPEQINYIKKNLQKDGNVLVFMNNAGFSIGDFNTNIHDLVGFNVKYDSSKVFYPGTYYNPINKAPLKGLDNIYTSSSTPLFYVEDSKATPLAYISGTKKVGAAMKNNGNWTSVYLSLPGVMSPQFACEIAKLAKVTPIGPQEDVTYAGNGFLVIHAMTGGEKTLQWTGKSDLFDISTGTTVAKGVESFTMKMEAFDTRWFKRRPVK